MQNVSWHILDFNQNLYIFQQCDEYTTSLGYCIVLILRSFRLRSYQDVLELHFQILPKPSIRLV
jgi:hypothetical protein